VNKPSEPRNRFVLRRESGHPGFRNHVFLSTPADLRRLADQLSELAEAGSGRIDEYVSEETNSKSLGSLAFQTCTEQELVAMQAGSRRRDFGSWIAIALCLVVLALAIIGAGTLIEDLSGSRCCDRSGSA
jgi:hypothetical protein